MKLYHHRKSNLWSVFAPAAAALPLVFAASALADDSSDFLSAEHLTFVSADGNQVLDKTAANLGEVFEKYTPALDSSSKIVSPKVVSGTASEPRLQVGIEACVLFICKTVDLDAVTVITPVGGACARNLLLTADLTRSSDILTEKYDALNVSICLNPSQAPVGSLPAFDLTVSASAHQAPQYSSGIVASNILRFLNLQTPAILQALNETLTDNGAQDITVAPSAP